jgi:hypothetical protein
MSDDNQANQSCGGKKKAMLAYGLIQISATVVSAISLAAIALSLCPLKQQSTTFNGCISEIIAQGESNAQAVRHCNGGYAKLLVLLKKGVFTPFFLHQQNKIQDGFSALKTLSSLIIACYSIPKKLNRFSDSSQTAGVHLIHPPYFSLIE